LFLVSNCTEEYLDVQDESLQKSTLLKNDLSQKQKIIELAEGIKPKILKYNRKYGKAQKFKRKYGKFDIDKIKVISFPQFKNEWLIIIPFKKKKNYKKKRLFIAYYKDGNKTYTVLRNKNYKKKLRTSTEEGFLTHLEVLFDYVYSDNFPTSKKTTVNKMSCQWVPIFVDQLNCYQVLENTCTSEVKEASLDEKGGCGDIMLDEIELYADPDNSGGGGEEDCPDGYEENDHGVCVPVSNGGSSDNDSSDDPNDPDTEGCAEMDYDCETEGESDDEEQQTDKLNTDSLNTTQKQLLDQAIIDLKNDCLGNVLYNSVNSVKVEVGNTTAVATYYPVTNTIKFNANNEIDGSRLGPELFHAYQQQLYGNLDEIYTGEKPDGGSNIEFEEKAFNMLNDMLSNNEVVDELQGTGTHIIVEGLQGETYDGTGSLGFWLSDILVNHPNGNITLNQSELNKWFSALDSFQKNQPQNCGDNYCAPIDKQLKPNAIISLLNKYFNSDCK